jgi:digeranylgeranylglycerophospholipid reductase
VEAGARFYYSSPVVSVLPGDQSIQVFANCNLRQAVIKAKVAVIASGVGGSLTSSAGLGQISYLGRGAQTEVHCEHLTEVEVYSGTHIAPGFFAWLVPAGQSRAKAGLLCVGNPRPHIVNFLNRLRESGRISGATGEISLGAVPLRPLRKSYSERVLVAGDAAGQVKSTTGGGIYFGVLCAGMAVQTIGDALDAGDLSAKRLSSYHRKWQKVLKQELSIDYWAHRFYKGLSNRQIEHIFDVIERNGIHESILASPDITFDWHGKAVLDALKHRSLQRSLSRMYPAANLGTSPSNR